MSTIKLNGASSGSSIIKAPDSGSTNQTFTLPASTGTLVTTTDAGVAGITSAADATAMTITSAERVGINKTSPDARLDISAASETGLKVTATVSGEYGAIIQSASTNATPITEFRSNGGTTRLQVMSDGRGLSQFTAKVWANWSTTGTAALNDSHNVSSLDDRGTGWTRINFSNNIGNSSYAVTALAGNYKRITSDGAGLGAGNVDFFTMTHSGTTRADEDRNFMIAFGD